PKSRIYRAFIMWRLHEQRIIKSADDLSAHLRDDFILLVGSAISGTSPPHLAMVNILYTLTGKLKDKLSSRSYSDQLYAKYCESLSDGAYKNLLQCTKFEEYLWLLSQASTRTTLDDLLNRLYTCNDNEYGPIH